MLTILLLVLSGCAPTGAQTADPTFALELGTDESPVGAEEVLPIELTEEQNGGTVALIVGDRLRVRVDGNPGTGFVWQPEKLDASLLEQVGEPEFTQNNNLPGGEGAFLFTFKALKAGATHLRLVYHRPFEKDTPPAQVFDVLVDIQER